MKKLTKLLFAGILAIALVPAVVASISSEKTKIEAKADDDEILEVNYFWDFMEAMKDRDVKKVQLNSKDEIIAQFYGSGYKNSIDVVGDKELILNGPSCFADSSDPDKYIYTSLLRIDAGNSLKITGNGSLSFMPVNCNERMDNCVIRVNGGSLEIDGEDVSIIGSTSNNTYCRAITMGAGNLRIKNGYYDALFAVKEHTESVRGGSIIIQGGNFIIEDGEFDVQRANNDKANLAGLQISGGTGQISGGYFHHLFMENDLNLKDYIDPICKVHSDARGYAIDSNMNDLAANYAFNVERPDYRIRMEQHFEGKFGSPCRVDYTLNFVPDYVNLYQRIEGEEVLVQTDFTEDHGFVNAVSYGGNYNWERVYYTVKATKNTSFGDITVVRDFHIDWTNFIVKLYAGDGTGDPLTLYPNMSTHKLVLPECSFEAPANKVFDKWRIGNNYYKPGEEATINSDTNVFAIYKAPSNSFTLEPKTVVVERSQIEYVVSFDGDFYKPVYAIEEKILGDWTEYSRQLYQGTHFRVFNEMIETTRTFRIVAHDESTDAVLGTTEQFDIIWKNTDSLTKYSLTYHAGEANTIAGNDPIVVDNLVADEEVYAAESGFTAPANKVFIGWAVNDPDDYESVYPGNRFKITGNTTLYAKYDTGCDLTIDSGDSLDGDILIEHIYGSFTLPECDFEAPANQRFAYWETDFGNKLPGDIIYIDSSTQIRAIYEDILYTVSFKANGGEGEMNPLVNVSGLIPLPACEFTAPEHCKFIGWAKDGPDGDLYPYDSEDPIAINDDFVLYAKWTYILHTVIYNAGEASSIEGNNQIVVEEVEEGSSLKLLHGLTYVAPEGKVFKGWALNTPTGTLLNANSSYEVLTDATFIAIWENEAKITVSFDANGGSGAMESFTLKGGKYIIPACEFVAPDGKEFSNWEINGVSYNANDFVVINSDTQIKAVWKDKVPEGGGETPVTPDEPAKPQEPKGLSGGAIAVIVIGSVLVVGLGGFAVFWFVIKKKTFADLAAVFKKK